MMGIFVSLFRRKESTESVLENLSKQISYLQESRVKCSDMERRVASRMIIYSCTIYLIAAIGWYYWGASLSQEWYSRLLYTLPFFLSPILLVLLRRALRWFFVRRINKTEDDLKRLEGEREEIFRQLMEKETYKKVVELMKKYCPDKLKDAADGEHRQSSDSEASGANGQTPRSNGDVGKRDASPSQGANSLRHRRTRALGPLAGNQQGQHGNDGNPRPPVQSPLQGEHQPTMNQQPPATLPPGVPPPPPYSLPRNGQMVRPILSQNRSTADRIIDWVLGDGVENRYALICSTCCSHNGMALREEFEYLAFRCAYCGNLNPSKKTRAGAPNLIPLMTQNSLQSGAESTSSRQGSQLNLAASNGNGELSNANSGSSDNLSTALPETVEPTQ